VPQVELKLEHHTLPKKTMFGVIEKSLCQDKVFVKTDKGVWKQAGYLTHATNHFLPLVGLLQEEVEIIADALEKLKGKPIVGVPAIPPEQPIEPEDDEDDDT
jgi:hypothetical protein